MKFTYFATFFACGALATACTVTNTTTGSGGSGGTGSTTTSGKTSTTSKTASVTTGANNPTTTTTGGGNACDTGVHGSLLTGASTDEQKTCVDCIKCSQSDLCMAEWQAYGGDPNYQAYFDCNKACASGATACFDACSAKYPTTDGLNTQAFSCSICNECKSNCDAANTCTAGTGGAGSTGTGN